MRAYRPVVRGDPRGTSQIHYERVSDAEDIFRLPNPMIIVPSVSVGNVGQLAIDLLVESTCHDSGQGDKQHAGLCGVVHHPLVLPCYGGYPYSGLENQNKPMAHPIDVYHVPDTPVFLIQQRAPAAAGCQVDFAMDLMGWLASGGVTRVWIVGGLDATLRRDEDIQNDGLRYVCPPASDGHDDSDTSMVDMCSRHGIQPLVGDGENGRHWRGVWDNERIHMPWALLDAARDAGMSAVGMFKFVLEGDNTADAQVMAQAMIDVAISSSSDETVSRDHLKQPPSWTSVRPIPPGYVF